MKILFEFLKSKIFFKHITIIVLLIIIIIFSVLKYLDSYTKHGEFVLVPNLKGLNEESLKDTLEKHNLNYKIIDSVYSENFKKGTVIKHHPDEGFKVKENRTIYITINAKLSEMIKMPELVDLSLRIASSRLETYGLKVGKKTYIPYLKGAIKEQLFNGKPIKTGTKIAKGSKIDLVIGMGESNEKVSCPYLISLSADSATHILLRTSLNLGMAVYDQTVITSEDSAIARVYKQSPEASFRKTINMGNLVDIYLTLDSSKVILDSNFIILPIYDSLLIDSLPQIP